MDAMASGRTSGRCGIDLKPAVLGGPADLSQEARKQILALSGARRFRFWRELIQNWLAVALLVALGEYSGNFWIVVVCVLGISTRQMVFGLLLHEQVHRLGENSRFGDWIVNLLAVYPLGAATVENYAAVHLAHHKYFFTEKDPDFIRKAGPDWTFPISIAHAIKIVSRDLSALNTIALIRGKTAPRGSTEFRRPNPSPAWLRISFYLALFTAVTVAGVWPQFLIYWVLPLLTTTQLLVRWIAVIEHRYNEPNAKVHSVTPIIRLTWWQKIVLPDLNFAQHVYHHLHPGVSFANLPKVHAIYEREGLVDRSAIFEGQGSYLRYLVGRD